MGQVVGTAAALCQKYDSTPREVGTDYILELQQRLLRDDQWIIGVPNTDPDDLARGARVTASSVHPYRVDDGDDEYPLTQDLGIHVTAVGPLDQVSLLCVAENATQIDVEIWAEDRPENYAFGEKVGEVTVQAPGGRHWIEIPVKTGALAGQGVFLVVKAAQGVRIMGVNRLMTGLIACPRKDPNDNGERGWGFEWRPMTWVPCVRVSPEPDLYRAANVVDGFSRPWGAPHCWMSQPLAVGTEEWIELDLGAPREVGRVHVVYNTNLTPWYDELQNFSPAPKKAFTEAVSDYRVEVGRGGAYQEVARVTDNFQRVRRHTFEPIVADKIRITVSKTHGSPVAEIFEVRAYPR
jgi:hypothetical protein